MSWCLASTRIKLAAAVVRTSCEISPCTVNFFNILLKITENGNFTEFFQTELVFQWSKAVRQYDGRQGKYFCRKRLAQACTLSLISRVVFHSQFLMYCLFVCFFVSDCAVSDIGVLEQLNHEMFGVDIVEK
jgi:hypothetical protein